MPFAVNLRASGDAAAYWELVDRAASLEVTPSIRALGYPPHLTLAKYDLVVPGELESAVDTLAGRAPIPLRFQRIGAFDRGVLILWAAPTPDPALAALHARVHALLDPARCTPAYRPGQWVPHCTLALCVAESQRIAAERLLAAPLTPFVLSFDVVDCVSSPPINVLAERVLQSASATATPSR
ncbi:2'-5' RNA ligase family protein [Xanthomonas oryzae pv. oryzicola]|uniref:2'-5' RNA ligase family protein n=1 Tax=Xanthomonas oryzae TaxID=347 RepID=UPI0005CE860D|nr:2'-5' RNA ligase family protein [Xanthomonas oryzae]AJQ87275.1 hypothetical protein BE73_09330 [Xanthomonas oryzae pv. oryzicola]AKK63761.1 hypothetical protein FE36_07845 [Xanthomonas oryzae pv. oryzicola]AKO01107.1 hypothetical protein ACU15_11995 [Xanthomonas oryzae pv. oryzicola]KOR52658.1 hypothetical protein ADT27_00935 [Xanthomonas oryzae]OLK90438.1 hypothetical protein BXOR1_06045 [Xanthomonas oryzae pv. oryzicola]